MKTIVIALILGVVLCNPMLRTEQKNVQSTSIVCPAPQYRSTSVFNAMMDKVYACHTGQDMINVLKVEVPKDTHVFSANQILDIFDAVTFSDYKAQALNITNPYIEQLTDLEITAILNAVTFSDTKLACLQVIADTLNDTSDLSINYIVDHAFTFSSDKLQAKQILQNAKQRNCIYGTITEKVAIFIVDASGSMWETFKTSDGKVYSRIKYVQAMLTSTIQDQLKPFQMFNVIAFGTNPYPWKPDCMNATADNIQSAMNFINGLSSLGGTDISDTISRAFQTKYNLEAIYFLSDGYPNYGITDVNEMKLSLISQNNQRVQKGFPAVRIDVTSFMLGGTETPAQKIQARDFMQVIASTTNGKFRDMNDLPKTVEQADE